MSFRLHCPSCNHNKNVSSLSLFSKGRWRQLLCSACYSTSTARKWRCVCDTPWIGCSIHSYTGFACGRRTRLLHLNRRLGGGLPCVRRTNLQAPPTPAAPCTQVLARKRARTGDGPRSHAHSHAELPRAASVPIIPFLRNIPPTQGTKRVASKPHASRRGVPKAKSGSAGADVATAIQRLKEARANPL